MPDPYANRPALQAGQPMAGAIANGGAVPLELFVMGVARDMAAKTQLLTSAPR